MFGGEQTLVLDRRRLAQVVVGIYRLELMVVAESFCAWNFGEG